MLRNILSRSYKAIIVGSFLMGFAMPVWAADDLPTAQSFLGAYLAGRVALNDKQMDLGLNYLYQALKFDRSSEMVQRDLFLTLLANGKFKEAVPLAHLLLNNTDLERFSKSVIAADAMAKKNYKQAIRMMQYSNPDALDAVTCGIFSAWAKFGQGQRRAAINDIEAFKGQEWFRFFKNYHLALMYSLNGQKKEAEIAFEAALQDHKNGAAFPDSYEHLLIAYANFQWNNKNPAAAIATLVKGEELLSGRETITKIRIAAQNGKPPIAVVRTAIDGASEIVFNLGAALNRTNSEYLATLYLQISLAMRPNDAATLFQLADLSAKLGAVQNAIAYYQQIKPNSAYFHDSQLRMALNLAEADEQDKAIELLNNLIVQFTDDERLYISLAGIYLQNNDFANVVQVLDKYLNEKNTVKTTNWILFYQRAIAYERLKLWDKAEADFRQALRVEPNQPDVLNYLGYSLIDRNIKLDDALKMVQNAVKLRPQDGAIVDSLGWGYFKLRRFDDAVRELEKAIKLRPEDFAINDHLGDAYWMSGRKLEATFQWKHALDSSKIESSDIEKIQKKLKYGLTTDGSVNDTAKDNTKKSGDQSKGQIYLETTKNNASVEDVQKSIGTP